MKLFLVMSLLCGLQLTRYLKKNLCLISLSMTYDIPSKFRDKSTACIINITKNIHFMCIYQQIV